MGRVGLAAKCNGVNLIQAAGPSSLSSFANIGLGRQLLHGVYQLDSGPLLVVVVWETGQWTELQNVTDMADISV